MKETLVKRASIVRQSLANTKLRKNKIQLILIRNLPRFRTQVMQALPYPVPADLRADGR
jgi:hypothetical protein